MSTEAKNAKRLTFQGVIDVERQKFPEKSSRSKSRNRSKASSISKSMANISQLSNRYSQKVQPRKSPQKQNAQKAANTAVSQSLFRQNKRTAEQQMMRKIIKLKNTVTRIEANIKENLSSKQKPQIKSQQDIGKSKFVQIQNFLQEFDAQTIKQVKQIGENYINQLQKKDKQLEKINKDILNYKFITVPQCGPQMPDLERKLKQLELNL